jgi:hypothetical protein
MRMLVAFLIVLGAIYLWDANFNNGILTAGAKSMLQDIGRSIRYAARDQICSILRPNSRTTR